MKFQVSPAPGCEPDHSRKKLWSGIGQVLFPSAFSSVTVSLVQILTVARGSVDHAMVENDSRPFGIWCL